MRISRYIDKIIVYIGYATTRWILVDSSGLFTHLAYITKLSALKYIASPLKMEADLLLEDLYLEES